jgi:hypothetical protein
MYTHNGWMDDQAGLDWFEPHFELHARPSRSGAPRLLLCNNHSPHDTYGFRKFYLDHNIQLFFLPGHAAHIFRSLDVVIFIYLVCSTVIVPLPSMTKPPTSPSPPKEKKNAFMPLCKGARKKGVRPHNVKQAWEKVGIYPWSPKAVLEDPEVQAYLRDQDEQEQLSTRASTP